MKTLWVVLYSALIGIINLSLALSGESLSDPFSMHAFCTDSHAGVRFVALPNSPFLDGISSLKMSFECFVAGENVTFNKDDCFDGSRLPYFPGIKRGEWHWYILERPLSVGSVCSFTAKLKRGFSTRQTITSNCTVKSNLEHSHNGSEKADISTVTPAVCSASWTLDDDTCSCSCDNGFSGGVMGGQGLLCKNIDECSVGTHQCIDGKHCIDTEGGHICNDTAETTTTSTTTTASNTASTTTASTTTASTTAASTTTAFTTDASTTTASTTDASTTDASNTTASTTTASTTNASTTTASTTDASNTTPSTTTASSTDASTTDASTTDASTTTASTTTASTTDASTTDASTTDASTTDASTTATTVPTTTVDNDDPFSMHAFCTDSHAGVRFMALSNSPVLDEINSLKMAFECLVAGESATTFNKDDCFDGTRLPYFPGVKRGEWHWYILERRLSVGSVCSFTAKLKRGFSTRQKITSNCTVQSNPECSDNGPENCGNSTVTPAVCSDSETLNDGTCSCSCDNGFTGGVVFEGLLCNEV